MLVSLIASSVVASVALLGILVGLALGGPRCCCCCCCCGGADSGDGGDEDELKPPVDERPRVVILVERRDAPWAPQSNRRAGGAGLKSAMSWCAMMPWGNVREHESRFTRFSQPAIASTLVSGSTHCELGCGAPRASPRSVSHRLAGAGVRGIAILRSGLPTVARGDLMGVPAAGGDRGLVAVPHQRRLRRAHLRAVHRGWRGTQRLHRRPRRRLYRDRRSQPGGSRAPSVTPITVLPAHGYSTRLVVDTGAELVQVSRESGKRLHGEGA